MFKKCWDYLSTEGAIKAKLNGVYLNTYKMIKKIQDLGIYPDTFIDVGANRGMLSKTVHYIFPNCNIYSFEPIKACFAELMLIEKNIPNLKCFNCALSDYEGNAEFNESAYDYSSSLLKMANRHETAFPHTKGMNVYNVDVYPLEYFTEKLKIKSPVVLKLDVQGAELKVLQGAGKLLDSIDYILCEISFTELYKGQPLLTEVVNFMEEKCFKLYDIFELNRDPQNGELLQMDGFFQKIK